MLSFLRSVPYEGNFNRLRSDSVAVVIPLQDEDDLWTEEENWEVEEWGDEWDDFNDEDDW